MRVIGGHDRGRRIRTPRGLRTRPTADRVRETLFDVLGPAVAGARVLDLFAGTGAVGIEALSRGAARVVVVERDPSALRALRGNLAALGASRAAARVVAGDVLHVLPELGAQEGPFDFVFVDPPYATTLAGRTLEALAAARVCRDGTEVVVQHSTRTVLPPVQGLSPHRRPRRFGDTALTFFRAERYTPDGSRP
jgi:16S rRNA (guanine966-N2)-methyltransferase